jgi:hypothetical protein
LTIIFLIADRASSSDIATVTPLPAAKPSALTTRGKAEDLIYSLAFSGSLKLS